MKGRTLVIGIILSVVVIVGLIYFLMMSTINKIKEENNEVTSMMQVEEDVYLFIEA